MHWRPSVCLIMTICTCSNICSCLKLPQFCFCGSFACREQKENKYNLHAVKYISSSWAADHKLFIFTGNKTSRFLLTSRCRTRLRRVNRLGGCVPAGRPEEGVYSVYMLTYLSTPEPHRANSWCQSAGSSSHGISLCHLSLFPPFLYSFLSLSVFASLPMFACKSRLRHRRPVEASVLDSSQ